MERPNNERMIWVIHHVQMSPSHLNLHKFLTTSLKTIRRKLITVDYRKYTLKFNKYAKILRKINDQKLYFIPNFVEKKDER
jgi:hypothetical protein